jgi:hypothetical protein
MCLILIPIHVQQLATNSFSTLLEKFKEKKMNVVTVMRECVDAFYPILGKIYVLSSCFLGSFLRII